MAERAWLKTGEGVAVNPAIVPIPDHPRGILALDIDGTLLGPGGVLSERTRQAVHAAGTAGWLVTLATGRRWGSTKPVADALGLEVPLICFNGALIRDSVSGAIIHYNALPAAAVSPLVAALAGRGLQPVIYEDFQNGERLLTGPIEHDSEHIGRWLTTINDEYGPIILRLPYETLAQTTGATRILVFDEVIHDTRVIARCFFSANSPVGLVKRSQKIVSQSEVVSQLVHDGEPKIIQAVISHR